VGVFKFSPEPGAPAAAVTEAHDDGMTLARTYRDAPEVDGYVIIPGELPLGEMVQAKIVDAMEYDLVGEVESLLQK